MLTGYETFRSSGGLNFSLYNTAVDGLGRLKSANETIKVADGRVIDHSYNYRYDMLDQLVYSYASNVPPTPAREYEYDYDKTGNMTHYMFNNYNPDARRDYYYTYTADERTGKTGGKHCSYDLNGRQTSLWQDEEGDYPVEYNWDGKIRWNKSLLSNLGIEAKYSPDGARVWKKYNWNLASYEHKYIYDPVGDVPTLLLVLDAADASGPILYSYIHANNQVLVRNDYQPQSGCV